jgi:hypothetical protein
MNPGSIQIRGCKDELLAERGETESYAGAIGVYIFEQDRSCFRTIRFPNFCIMNTVISPEVEYGSNGHGQGHRAARCTSPNIFDKDSPRLGAVRFPKFTAAGTVVCGEK